jgi:hypothetical protein
MKYLRIFYDHFGILRPFGVFYGHLVYFVVIWYVYIFPFWYVTPTKIWQPCLGVRPNCNIIRVPQPIAIKLGYVGPVGAV